ncbi:MAG: FAD-dependent oxidoreductase [Planctomycetota bacterium]|nr:FAD-dependent oxidoreductase [Planctomycetota bacterium]
MSESHTVIVGGGIVGICAAYFLARRGAAVTLLEQDGIDEGASTGNAGLISIGHAPIPRPGLTPRAIRWMFDPTSPIYIPPRLDLGLLRWFWGFRRACGRKQFKHSMDILTAHGRPAGECIRRLVDEEDLDCEYQPRGQMDVFRTEEGLEEGEREAAMMRDYGYGVEVLDGDELRRREPAFRDDVVGAVLFNERAFANPGRFVSEMADRARRRGAVLRERHEITRLLTENGRCVGAVTRDGEEIRGDAVILAAGSWTRRLARQVGLNLPLQPAKGYHVNLTRPEPCTNTACVCAERFVAVTPMADGLRLAGTLELSGINHRIVQQRVDMLRRGARLYLRGIDETRSGEPWCGLRPCIADGLPVVGWAPGVDRLFLATGHAMMGFALGPLAGRVACECVLGDEPSVDISGLRADRFG